MAGYALTWELNLAGPWGTVAWVVVGTGLTIAMGAGMAKLEDELSKSRTRAPAVPLSRTAECEKCKRYTARVHAQGKDCGGRTTSTIGVPALVKSIPVTVAEGLLLSKGTQGLLNRSQLEIRVNVIVQAEKYIMDGPKVGGRLREKSFVVRGVRGGIRYDVDTYGDGPSFVS